MENKTSLVIRCKTCGGNTEENEMWQGARKHSPPDNDYPYADDYCIRPEDKYIKEVS